MATTIYGLPNDKDADTVLLETEEVNALGDTTELGLLLLAELVAEGFFLSTDANATIIAGSIALQMSAVSGAVVGDTGGRKLLKLADPVTITATHGLTPSATNYVYLQRDGTYTANTSGVAPSNARLCVSAVLNGTEATSVNNNPAGRVNLVELVLLNKTQTLTGKTLTSPTLTTPTITTPTMTGGSWTGGTDLAVADGGTGASTAAAARTNLAAAGSATLISSGTGMQGGGDLSANRTLALSAQAQKDLGRAPGVTAAAEAANARTVTIQLKEFAADLTSEARLVRVWIGDLDLGAECAAAPDGGVVFGSGTIVQTITAGKQWMVMSTAAGVITLTLTESTAKTFYVMAGMDSRVTAVAVAFV